MQIPNKQLRGVVESIMQNYCRQSFLSTTIPELTVCYHEAHYQLSGIQLLLSPGEMLFFVKNTISSLGNINGLNVDKIRTRQMALEVELEAFPPNTGDLGRSPAVQSSVAVGQGSTQ